jgi:hypothetical protein
MDPKELAPVLVAMGCPELKALEMAGMLDKRAKQLVEKENISHEAALARLLSLMKQGWAAKERGF